MHVNVFNNKSLVKELLRRKITDNQFILSVFIHTNFKIAKMDEILRENEVENLVENTSKFAKILNENFERK